MTRVAQLADMAVRVQTAIEGLGSPAEVLPACLLVCMRHAHSAGATPEEFVGGLLPLVSAVWGKAVDPTKLATAIADAVERDAAVSGDPLSPLEQGMVASIRTARRRRRRGQA